MNLIVNPLAAIETVDETGELILGGPVPGRGMKYLHLSASECPRLHSLLTELPIVGLRDLNVDADLEPDELELLRDYGVLIGPENVPERPLFSCMLDDVEASGALPASLIVNPTLELQPFDLAKFRSWMQEKHLSPYNATAWVTDPATKIRWGYWLTPAQAELVGNLQTGSDVLPDIDPELKSKLTAAHILIDADSAGLSKRVDTISRAADQFARDRYAVITDVVPPAQLRALQDYFRRYVEQGFMKFGDMQVERRFAEHGEPVAKMFLETLEPFMGAITRVPIERTYAYTAVYAEGAELRPHVDREACVFSFSFQLEYLPEPDDGVSPWPLYLSQNDPADLNVDPQRDTAIHLANGGFLAYKGREIIHYRTPLPAGHRSASIFFHYVPVGSE